MSRAAVFQSQLPHEAKRSISLAPIVIPNHIDTPEDIRDNARRFLEHRTIKEGLDCWRDIDRVNNSFSGWLKIGRALLIGKTRALRLTGANAPWGRRYCLEFSNWMIEHHFDKMPAPTRSVAIELAEHEAEISAWRDGLSEKQRRRLVHPLSVTRRWRAATQPKAADSPEIRRVSPTDKSKVPDENFTTARDAWRRFCCCMEALPPDQAAPLWQEAQAQAAEFLGRDVGGSTSFPLGLEA